jgi:DNA-binding transcriptional MerR regulator
MYQFTIKDIENLSGIKAHTWRIWEQRYGIGTPQRKDSNHRYYDNENLKQILRISFLYHTGTKISKIAALSPEEIKVKAMAKMPEERTHEHFIKELLEAAIDLDEELFDQTLEKAIKQTSIEETVVDILYPFQEKIGVLWLTDHVIPAQEHFTSNIIRKKLSVAIDSLPYIKETTKKIILLFTPENEQHEIPLQFIYYRLRKNGNKVIYFGSNVKLESLKAYTANALFDYMLFHLLTHFKNTPEEYLHELAQTFPDKKIIMSGKLVERITQVPTNVKLLKSMQEIIAFTDE